MSDSSKLFLLDNIDPEEIGEVLVKIERSFHIKLSQDDLAKVTTFGNLCEVVHHKIKLEHSDTCTTQQAFYKLRNAITGTTGMDRHAITTQTCLKDIFPEDDRLWLVKAIENDMGLKLNVLQPKASTGWMLFGLLTVSVAMFWFNIMIAYTGIALFVTGAFMAGKFGKELSVKTLGQLAEKIAREHYLKCRRDASSINRKEVEQKVRELFKHDLQLDDRSLGSGATFRYS